MARSFEVDVEPAVLVWARRTSGYRPDEVAHRLKVDEERVRAWEAGDERPTLAKLRKLADVYHRPLPVLLLEQPPAEPESPTDFRSPAEVGEMSPALRFAIRAARERREIALELQDSTPDGVGSFDVTAELDEDPEAAGARLRSALGVSFDDQQATSSSHAALSLWRSAVEGQGVLVFGLSGVAVHEARGFSLNGRPFPVIGLNSSDAPQGRVFTLLHELTHLALRTGSALCDLSDRDAADPRLEVFCNHAAGAALVPSERLLQEDVVARASSRTTWSARSVSSLARRFGVSREVILRRLLILGRTSAKHYEEWRKVFRQEQKDFERKRAESKGGPPYVTTKASQLGRLYPRLVFDAYGQEKITTSAASEYLGVKVKHFDHLAAEIAAGRP